VTENAHGGEERGLTPNFSVLRFRVLNSYNLQVIIITPNAIEDLVYSMDFGKGYEACKSYCA
jgi:hypothetical protein